MIHSRSVTADPRNGAMKTCVCAPVAPAANAIHRPSGEKRALNRLLDGCESTVCSSPVEIFIKSTIFDRPVRTVSRLDPSGDQSQILKQPFNVEDRPALATSFSETTQVLSTMGGKTSCLPSGERSGRYPT